MSRPQQSDDIEKYHYQTHRYPQQPSIIPPMVHRRYSRDHILIPRKAGKGAVNISTMDGSLSFFCTPRKNAPRALACRSCFPAFREEKTTSRIPAMTAKTTSTITSLWLPVKLSSRSPRVDLGATAGMEGSNDKAPGVPMRKVKGNDGAMASHTVKPLHRFVNRCSRVRSTEDETLLETSTGLEDMALYCMIGKRRWVL
ncbi:hypothetical protein P171DRAFT_437220 [Karstenula rhodostoma CBS 690.94]|uniref:Uncharacterized protein n=1 Tax=Karstenula rhodostoma CBS 690.94 TaxID=1392251 RepID=A0A9P4P6I2_9PLEO|nr:hypothetical protein P171DRAFT_437220 [Karstenula rhodostoma CBS 690.94]